MRWQIHVFRVGPNGAKAVIQASEYSSVAVSASPTGICGQLPCSCTYKFAAVERLRRLVMHVMRCERARIIPIAAILSTVRMPMMTIVIASSNRVNAREASCRERKEETRRESASRSRSAQQWWLRWTASPRRRQATVSG